ncbi:MAG: Glutamyl-tRNA reductase [uncultured Bacteroidota bacterium]|nr:MAG: Glutamyl-tRNA reductase [uncultured Bacteroidetes bacterium]
MTKSRRFYAVGVSHKTATIDHRGYFSLSDSQLHALFLDAKEKGIQDLLLINTCNRTEIYAWTFSDTELVELLCTHSEGTQDSFNKIGYSFEDEKGIHHLFRVGTGLESQILGDFEIIGQIKQSFYRSKKMGLAQRNLERLTNSVIQASKRIKTETQISSGATSVAFASVKYILKNVRDIAQKNILLFGTGKIGANTCENLVKHSQNDHIVLINRTQEKAEKIAGKFPVQVKPFGELTASILESDVLIVATSSQKPTITADLIHNNKPLLILDLSLPRNVDPLLKDRPNTQVIHLDELSQITDATFEKRKKFIPQAEGILDEVKLEFLEWLELRKYVPTLKAFREKIKVPNQNLEQISKKESEYMAQKIMGQIAAYLRSNPHKAEETVHLLKDVFELNPERYSEK